MINDEGLLDRDVVRELREMLGAGLEPVLIQFGDQTTRLVTQIQGLAAAGDFAAARALAHKLKGSAGSVGARALSAEAALLERFAAAGDADALTTRLAALPDLVSLTAQALYEVRDQRGV